MPQNGASAVTHVDAEDVLVSQRVNASWAGAAREPEAAGRRWTRATWGRVGRFVLHLAEMLLAMEAGMLLFHLLVDGALARTGIGVVLGRGSDLHGMAMAAAMTLPMVGWMRARGHGWRLGTEMAAAMLAPTAIVALLCRFGLDASVPWVGQLGGVGMYVGMLAAMLYRRQHYVVAHGRHSHAPSERELSGA